MYYRKDEHAAGDSTKQVIGYEIAFLTGGRVVFMHLPAIDSFENMMQLADVVEITIE